MSGLKPPTYKCTVLVVGAEVFRAHHTARNTDDSGALPLEDVKA